MKFKKNIFYATLFGSALLFQCKEDEPATAKVNADVYVGGAMNIGADNLAAAFTKNGVMDTLENGNVSSAILDITVSDEDVYMAGEVGDDAVYWKNGEINTLSIDAGYYSPSASNILVKGQDVYLAGVANDDNNGTHLVYWKNGEPTMCGKGWPSFGGDGLVVSDAGDVYVGGSKAETNMIEVVGYWKNGVWNPVSDPLGTARGGALALDGDDIYVAGFYLDEENRWVATYWKNGNRVDLTDIGSFAYGIKVVNGNVYVTGSAFKDGKDIAVYWKNGTMVSLADAEEGWGAYAYSIQFAGKDVYVLGEVYDECEPKTMLWKNGKTVAPFDGNQECYFGEFYTLHIQTDN